MSKTHIDTPQRFDERDTIFARLALKSGSRSYRLFYRHRPEWRIADDQIRERGGLLRLLMQQGLTEKELETYQNGSFARLTARIQACFPALARIINPLRSAFLRRLSERLSGQQKAFFLLNDSEKLIREWVELEKNAMVSPTSTSLSAAEMTDHIKKAAKVYGADLVGITHMDDGLYYSHHRNGEPVDTTLRFAIVFAVETPEYLIKKAPGQDAMLATSMGYLSAASVGARLSMHIKSMGGRTFFNNVMSYNAPLVVLAEKAGIGQIGRSNVLLTREFGSRIRLGAVMTDLELVADTHEEMDFREFCQKCGNCARHCPGNAIDSGAGQKYGGRLAWAHDGIACIKQWQTFLTDCGICLAVCPFSRDRLL